MQSGNLWLLLAAAVLVALAPQPATAKITDAQLGKDARVFVPLDEPFGFSSEGRINITLTEFLLRPLPDPKQKKAVAPPQLNRMGIVVTTPYGELKIEDEIKAGKCPLDSEEQVTLFTFDSIDSKSAATEEDIVLYDLLENYQGGEFIMYFANCQADTAVDFKIRLALYNQKGSKMDFLPVGQDMLPLLYLIMFALFAACAVVWVYVVSQGKQHSHKIHYLMVALVTFKALTLLSQAGMFHMVGIHGIPEGWNVAFYFFTAMRGILFFVVLILISTGWSYMRPFLADREKQILMIVVPLQVFANVAIVVTDEFTPAAASWFSWRDMWHIVDILCCCAILFPIVWSIKHLKEAAEMDDKAARVLSKLVLFRQFYIMVVSYIYFTRIIVYLLDATLPFQQIWLSALANELATLAFYVACGLQFRPHREGANPYFALEQDEVEMAKA